MAVSREMWIAAGRKCCFCRKGIRASTAVGISYTTKRIAHAACARRDVQLAH